MGVAVDLLRPDILLVLEIVQEVGKSVRRANILIRQIKVIMPEHVSFTEVGLPKRCAVGKKLTKLG